MPFLSCFLSFSSEKLTKNSRKHYIKLGISANPKSPKFGSKRSAHTFGKNMSLFRNSSFQLVAFLRHRVFINTKKQQYLKTRIFIALCFSKKHVGHFYQNCDSFENPMFCTVSKKVQFCNIDSKR